MATRVGHAYFFHERLGKGRATKSDEFSENWQGGGFIFNPKNHIPDVGNFKQGFLSIKLIQKSNFRVQGMFFSTIALRKNQNKTNFEKGSSSTTSLRAGSGY